MAHSGHSSRSFAHRSTARRRFLKFELLDQRRVLASLVGEVVGPVDVSLASVDSDSRAEYRVVEQGSAPDSAVGGSAAGGASAASDAQSSELVQSVLAFESATPAAITAGNDSLTYTAAGRQLTQIDLTTGAARSVELPGAIQSLQRLSDGRIVALLEPGDDDSGATTVVVSFGDEQIDVQEGTPDAAEPETPSSDGEYAIPGGELGTVQWASIAVGRGDRGLLVPASDGGAVPLHSLGVQPDTFELVSRTLSHQVPAGTHVFASAAGSLVLVAEPTEGAQRLSLWSTRVDSPVVGSEVVIPELRDVLLFDDATSIVVGRQPDGGIRLLDAANDFATLHSLSQWTGQVAFDAGRELLFGVLDDLTLGVFDVAEQRIVARVPLEAGAAGVVGGLALADGGNRLVISSSSGISQIRLEQLDGLRGELRTNAASVDALLGNSVLPDTSFSARSAFSAFEDDSESLIRIEPQVASVAENDPGALVTHFSVLGVDAAYANAVEIVEDERFVIDGSQLRLAEGQTLDYESESEIRLDVELTVDDESEKLRQTIVISVTDVNDPITDLALERKEIPEQVSGYLVGLIQVTDQDPHEYQFSVDDDRFEVVSRQLKLRDGVFVRRADQSEILLTVSALEMADPPSTYSEQFVLEVLANESRWHNHPNPTDVNNDGETDPLDALIIINTLNKSGPGNLSDIYPGGDDDNPFYDVNGDGCITPLDALIIINRINRGKGGQAEGGGGEGERVADAIPVDASRKLSTAETEQVEPLDAMPQSTQLHGPQQLAQAADLRRSLGQLLSDYQRAEAPAADATDRAVVEFEDGELRGDIFFGLDSDLS